MVTGINIKIHSSPSVYIRSVKIITKATLPSNSTLERVPFNLLVVAFPASGGQTRQPESCVSWLQNLEVKR